jgi:ribosomal protein S18 acetylase RimI-like enzyme
MDVGLRSFDGQDFEFVRQLYFDTMRWAIEPVFGWDQHEQAASFAAWFKPDEARIITADGLNVGWIQQRLDGDAIFLGSLYVLPTMQRKGIGTHVLRTILESARAQSRTLTLAVMKVNPALALYKRLGFQITHEDEYKFYMEAAP